MRRAIDAAATSRCGELADIGCASRPAAGRTRSRCDQPQRFGLDERVGIGDRREDIGVQGFGDSEGVENVTDRPGSAGDAGLDELGERG